MEHITGYEPSYKDPWDFKYNGLLTQEQKASHPKLSRDYPYNEMTEKYWMNDSDSLYKEEKDLTGTGLILLGENPSCGDVKLIA